MCSDSIIINVKGGTGGQPCSLALNLLDEQQ